MNLFAVCWSGESHHGRALEAALEEVASWFPQLDPDTRWRHSATRVHAIGITSPLAALGPRRYVASSADAFSFYDGLPVDSMGELPLHDAGIHAAEWNALTTRAEGGFVAVRSSRSTARLEIVTDPLGLRHVYGMRVGEAWLLSNHAMILARATGSRAIDPLGVASLVIWGWAAAGRTLLDGIRSLPPGSRIEWSDRTDGIATPYFAPVPTAASAPTDAAITALAEELVRPVAGIAGCFEPVWAGLTGGKDSRLLAAAMSQRRIPIEYRTFAPVDSREALAAAGVAKHLGLPHSVRATSGSSVAASWREIAGTFAAQNDGLVSLSQAQVMVGRPRQLDRLGVQIGGHGGEIARGFFLDPLVLGMPASRRLVERTLCGRLICDHEGLVRPEAVALAANCIRDFVSCALADGWRAIDVCDLFYVRERMGHWAAAVMRPIAPVNDLFAPLASRALVRASFSISPRMRYEEALHDRAIELLAPGLGSVGYEKHGLLGRRPVRDLARRLRTTHLVRAALGRKRRRSPELTWLQGALEDVRFALDHATSPIWDVLHRDRFDQLTRLDGDPGARSQALPGLLNAFAAIYYLANLRDSTPRPTASAEDRAGASEAAD